MKLEFSKKSSEGKLISFSSRMSPEGSELDVVDVSLSGSHSTNQGQSRPQSIVTTEKDAVPPPPEHHEISRTKMEYLCLTPPLDLIDDGEMHEEDKTESSSTPVSIVEDLKLQVNFSTKLLLYFLSFYRVLFS